MAFLSLFLHILVSPFKTRARLEAEIVLLRYQLNVLRRRVAWKPKLAVMDRLLFVWLYRLFPSVLSAVAIVQPDHHPMASDRFPAVLALEVARAWWADKDSSGDPMPDSGDEPGQSALGRSSHPRRIVEARDRCRAIDGRRLGRPFCISLTVTANPTAEWIFRQITEALPWNEAPDHLIRDREGGCPCRLTMKSGRICSWTRIRQTADRSSGTANLPRDRFSAVFIIDTVRCSIRQAQWSIGWPGRKQMPSGSCWIP